MATYFACELPFVSATSLDALLGGSTGIQKVRQEVRKNLGTESGRTVSVGLWGTIRIEPVPMLSCVAAGWRFDRENALKICQAYQNAGLAELVQTDEYEAALHLVELELKKARFLIEGNALRTLRTRFISDTLLAQRASMVAMASAALAHNPVFRSVAAEMHQINLRVDEQLREFKRLPGHIVRFEGPTALAVVHEDGRRQLRLFDSDMFRGSGIQKRGDTFVLNQLRFTPDQTVTIPIPSMPQTAPDSEETELKALLDADAPIQEPTPEFVEAGKFRPQ